MHLASSARKNKTGSRPVKLSKRESRLMAALRNRKTPISSIDLVEKVWPDPKDRPFHARQALVGAANSLARKLDANRDPLRLEKSERCGPHPIEFKLEPR